MKKYLETVWNKILEKTDFSTPAKIADSIAWLVLHGVLIGMVVGILVSLFGLLIFVFFQMHVIAGIVFILVLISGAWAIFRDINNDW